MERVKSMTFILQSELKNAVACEGCEKTCFGGEGQPIGVRIIKESGPLKTALLHYKSDTTSDLGNGTVIEGLTGRELVVKKNIFCSNRFFNEY